MGDVDELTKEFLAESLEGLDRMDRCLTDLEHRPNDKELLGEIFRAVHTIKGTTGFLGFSRLEKLAHAGETLLGSLRDGRLTANTPLVGGLLQLMDGLRLILRLIEQTGKEGTRASDEDGAFNRVDAGTEPMGLYILDPSAWDYLTPGQVVQMPELLEAIRHDGNPVHCYKSPCYWLDIGRHDDYSLANEVFEARRGEFLGGPRGNESPTRGSTVPSPHFPVAGTPQPKPAQGIA